MRQFTKRFEWLEKTETFLRKANFLAASSFEASDRLSKQSKRMYPLGYTETPEDRSFSQVIRDYRQRKGLTQRELAAKVEVTSSYICALEKGDKPPPPYWTVEALAKALDLDPEWLWDIARREREERARKLAYRTALRKSSKVLEKDGIQEIKDGLQEIKTLLQRLLHEIRALSYPPKDKEGRDGPSSC